jgi:hypothetical protein
MRLLFVQLAPKEVTARRVAAREARFKWKMAAAREADTGVAFACAVTWSLVRLLLVQLINMPAAVRAARSE